MISSIQFDFGVRRLRVHLILGLALALLAVPFFSASAQAERVNVLVFATLIELRDEFLTQLVEVVGTMEENPDLVMPFMEAPRDFLLNEGIDLPADAFQIKGVDFSVPPVAEEDPWFGVAEPLEGFAYEPKGIGVFYSNVAVFFQEAFEPVEEAPEGELTDHQTDMLRFMDARFPDDTLEDVRVVMRVLDELPIDHPRRLEFLANPREYFIGEGLTLPAYSYRIIAIDLNRAEAVGGVVVDEIRAGLAVVPWGIGVFNNSIGAFLQRAI